MATILGNLRGPDGEPAHVVAGDGIVVTGTGADDDPYVIALLPPPTVTGLSRSKVTPYLTGAATTITGTGLTQVGAWRLESGTTKVALNLGSTTDTQAQVTLPTALGVMGQFDLVGYADDTYTEALVTRTGAILSTLPVFTSVTPASVPSTTTVTLTVTGTDLDLIPPGRLVWATGVRRQTNLDARTVTETSFTILMTSSLLTTMKGQGNPWTLGWVRGGVDPSTAPFDAEIDDALTIT